MGASTRNAARRVIVLAALFGALHGACPEAAHAQQVTATLSCDRTTVDVGGVVRLVARADVNGASVESFQLPSLEGFVVRSRHVSNPMQVRFGFGAGQQVVSSTTVHTLLLEATRPGVFELSPLRVVAGGQTFESEPVTITVGGTAAPAIPGQPGAPPAAGGETTTAQVEGDAYTYDPSIFLRTRVNNTDPYVGEAITVQVLLFSRIRISSPEITRAASTQGFWTQDLLPARRQLTSTQEVVNGQVFEVYELNRFAAFPLQEGELTVGAPSVEVRQSRGLADFFNRGTGAPMVREGVALSIDVQPLPEPVPSPLLVGSGSLAVEVDRSQVRTGDAITLTATLRGIGQMSDVRLAFPEVDGLRVLEPQVDNRVTTVGDRVGGERVTRWLLIPERPGRYTLPRVRLATFNTVDGSYGELVGEELTIEAAGPSLVEPAQGESEAARQPNDTQEGSTPPSFETVRSESALARTHRALAGSPLFYGLLAGPPLLFLFLLGGQRLRRRKPSADKVHRKRRKERLSEAKDHASAGDARAFYAAIDKAIQDALEAKFEQRVGGLTRRQLGDLLAGGGMAESDQAAVLKEIETCDFARFSSAGSSAEEMAASLARTQEILSAIDGLQMTGASVQSAERVGEAS